MADLGSTKVYGDLQVTGDITGDVTGNADTATKLATARTIGGVAFDGSANINLPGVNTAGNQSTTGNAATSTKLATSRTISATGDATWTTSFDGSANATGALTLANSGVTAGTYLKVTVDAKGRVTAGSAMVAADVPALDASKITSGVFPDARLSGTYTGVNITGNAGSADTIRSTFVTSNTGGSYSNQYTKFLTITIPARYGDYDANLRLLSYANGGQPSRNSDLYIRVKQQNAFGSNPSVDVDHLTDDGDYAGIGYVIASNTGPTVVDFYIKNTTGWNVIAGFLFYKTSSGGTGEFLSTQGFSASVAGIVDVTTTRMFSDRYKPTADALTTARTINGVAFDGSANITVADDTKLPLTGGTLSGNFAAPRIGVSNTSATTGDGLSLYNGATTGMPSYGVAFAGTPTFGTHGSVTGDWATYFTMSGATSRGWIFKSGNTAGGNVASISATGVFSGNGSGLTALNASNLSTGTIPGDRGVTAGSTASSFVEYNGTTATAGQFDGGTTTPTGTTRLNYGGYFYPTFLNLTGSADTSTAATHYFVETGSDGFVRPKTLANVRNEIAAIVAGNSSIGPLRYSGTTKAAGTLDGGTSDPTSTTRLNYDGYFYATRFYGDASQLSVATTSANGVMSAADKARLDSLSAASGISEDDAIVLALIFG